MTDMEIASERLRIIALSHLQLQFYTQAGKLEAELGLTENGREMLPKTVAKIEAEVLPKIKTDQLDNVFHTFWIAVLKNQNVIAAELCFKGAPDENGNVEIGYATFENFRNTGVMTELIAAIANWIFAHTDVRNIVAETDPQNKASHRTLRKNGFVPDIETAGNLTWKLKKA